MCRRGSKRVLLSLTANPYDPLQYTLLSNTNSHINVPFESLLVDVCVVHVITEYLKFQVVSFCVFRLSKQTSTCVRLKRLPLPVKWCAKKSADGSGNSATKLIVAPSEVNGDGATN